MLDTEVNPSEAVRSSCPDCEGELRVLRVISGRAGNEYGTMRCIRCGGIHLNIVRDPSSPSSAA